MILNQFQVALADAKTEFAKNQVNFAKCNQNSGFVYACTGQCPVHCHAYDQISILLLIDLLIFKRRQSDSLIEIALSLGLSVFNTKWTRNSTRDSTQNQKEIFKYHVAMWPIMGPSWFNENIPDTRLVQMGCKQLFMAELK